MTDRLARLLHLAVLVAVLTPKAVWGEPHHTKFDQPIQQLLDRGCSGTHAVIVRTADGYQSGLATALKNHGNKVRGEYPSINAVAADVSCADLRTLADFDTVDSISSDAPVRAHAATKAEGLAAAALQAPLLQTLLGSTTAAKVDIGVAVIDSGVQAGIDFGSRLIASYEFANGGVRSVTPADPYGHGSHVAGLIASQYVGVAPTANIVSLKVLDGQGHGSTSDVLHAIDFAVANKGTLKIQVLNLSLGHPIFERAATDPLVQAVERAVRAGLVVVVSAGNFGVNQATGLPGYAGIASPGNAPSAITVGATQTQNTVSRLDDRVAPYSSRGPSWYDGFAKPDVVAPGHGLLSVAADGSTLRLMMEARGNTGNYMRLSGSSMATAVTSGVVALVIQASASGAGALGTGNGLTPNALKAVLEYSAIAVNTDSGQPADDLTQGAGEINAVGAVTLATAINTKAAIGQKWLTSYVAPYSWIGFQLLPWGKQVVWGNHIARGTGILTEQRPAWALNVVWGEALEADDNIVWGNLFGTNDNIVWGNNFDLGDNIVWGNNLVWGNSFDFGDNIVWGNSFDDDNIVWGNNVVWGNSLIGMMFDDDNIVWGNCLFDDDNIVWGNLFDDNIVWGNNFLDDDNIVWGNTSELGAVTNLIGSAVKGGLN